MKILVKREDKTIPLPKYQTLGSAGFDLHSAENCVLKSGEYKAISTGLRIAIPQGYEAQLRPRSGLAAKNGISVLNTPGTIDSDYRGLVYAILINHGKNNFEIKKGDRIAQLVINKIELPELEEAEEISETKRGERGFGSTGI